MHDLAVDLDFALRRAQLAADQTQNSRLAGAGTAHDRYYLAARKCHIQASQDRTIAVAKMQIMYIDDIRQEVYQSRKKA